MADERPLFADIKAVVFDFDGVILESTRIKTEAFLQLFGDYPEHLEAIRRYHLENVGISRFRKFQWIHQSLLEAPLTDAGSRKLGERFSEIVLEQMLRCPFVPGATETLERMRGQVPAFVASGTPEGELHQIVEARDLGEFFVSVHGSPRPKPEILRDLVRGSGLPSRRILFVGDGPSDHAAAQAAEVLFLARRTEEQAAWLQTLPTPQIDDLRGLPELLGLP